MAYNRIKQIQELLFLRETKHMLVGKTRNYTAIHNLIQNGISSRVVFVSSNPILLKATEQNIKGNIITVLMPPLASMEVKQAIAVKHMVLPAQPEIIIFDKQMSIDENLIKMLMAHGYEVYEF